MSHEDATLPPQIVPADPEAAAALAPDLTGSEALSTQKEIPKKQKVLLKCPYSNCTKEFKKQAHLDRHLSSHTKEKPFVCTFVGCEKAFGRIDHFRRHEAAHFEQTKPHACDHPGCNQRFAFPHGLKRHKENQHEKEKPFKCTFAQCSESFSKANQLRRHQCIHTGEDPYKCKVTGCSYGCLYPSQLKKHMAVVHEPPKFLCTIEECGMEFSDKHTLALHSTEAHRVDEKLMCHHCLEEFLTMSSLKHHLNKEHSLVDAMTHPCAQCGKTYSRKSNLQAHIRSAHTSERPYTCSHHGCTSAFAHKYLLARHKLIHSRAQVSPSLLPAAEPVVARAIDTMFGSLFAPGDTLAAAQCASALPVALSSQVPAQHLGQVASSNNPIPSLNPAATTSEAGVSKRCKQSCVSCRNSKVKCTGVVPCPRCIKQGINCVLYQPERQLKQQSDLRIEEHGLRRVHPPGHPKSLWSTNVATADVSAEVSRKRKLECIERIQQIGKIADNPPSTRIVHLTERHVGISTNITDVNVDVSARIDHHQQQLNAEKQNHVAVDHEEEVTQDSPEQLDEDDDDDNDDGMGQTLRARAERALELDEDNFDY